MSGGRQRTSRLVEADVPVHTQPEDQQIETTGAREAHADIDYRAMAVAPADIQNAVVNVLRFHEAKGALVFCATRENVRRLSATLTERGFCEAAGTISGIS